MLAIFLFSLVFGDFCQNQLFESIAVCEDGSVVQPSGCCRQTNRCPKSCLRYGFKTRGQKRTCTCDKCALKPRIALSDSQRWLKSHNFFRCRMDVEPLQWDSKAASNAKRNTDICKYSHSSGTELGSSYKFSPPSGENIAMGFPTIEATVEGWFKEYNQYAPGTGFAHGIGHYTAMIWKKTTALGCSSCVRKDYSVCEYAHSPPNYGGTREYIRNVPQIKHPKNSEALCCAQVYGSTEILRLPHSIPTGAARDAHGCLPSAGYKWCDFKQKCFRDFEEDCPVEESSLKSCYHVQIDVSFDSHNHSWRIDDACSSRKIQVSKSVREVGTTCCLLANPQIYTVTCSKGTVVYLNRREICRGKGTSRFELETEGIETDELEVNIIEENREKFSHVGPGSSFINNINDDFKFEVGYFVAGSITAIIAAFACYIFWSYGISEKKPEGYDDLANRVSLSCQLDKL